MDPDTFRPVPGTGRVLFDIKGFPVPQPAGLTLIPIETFMGLEHLQMTRAAAKHLCPDLDNAPCTYPHCTCRQGRG